jgi:hypothetical protein
MTRLSDFKGAIKKCHCTNSDPQQPMDCKHCLCRGYLAQCLGCQGQGQIRVPVAGAHSGDMASTCHLCGGSGTFPSNAPVPEPALAEPAIA